MNKNQRLASDFAKLATIHARDGENVVSKIIEALTPTARGELRDISAALTRALTGGPNPAAPDILQDFNSPATGSPMEIMAQSDPTDAATPMSMDAAIPRVGTIAVG